MEASFVGKMNGLNIAADVQTYLENKNIKDEEAFGILAVVEAEVKTIIVPFLKAGGFELKEMSETVAITKLWLSCRRTMNSAQVSTPAAGAENPDELPKETRDDLKSQWFKAHGFIPPETWMLSSALQTKLWRATTAPSPGIEMVLMENLRLLCQKTRASAALMNLATGEKSRVEVDMVHGPMEVYTRARAWFTTAAYVSIRQPAWFDFQTAVFAAEKILELVQKTSLGQLPPVQVLIEAWAATLNLWSEHVRISGGSLKQCVLNTGTWEHKWTWSSTSGSAGAAAGVDLPRDVATDVENARAQARFYQSMVDKEKNEQRRIREEGQRFGVEKKQQKGNGYGNGKGKNYKGNKNGKGNGDGRNNRGFSPDRRDRSRGRGDRAGGRGNDRR